MHRVWGRRGRAADCVLRRQPCHGNDGRRFDDLAACGGRDVRCSHDGRAHVGRPGRNLLALPPRTMAPRIFGRFGCAGALPRCGHIPAMALPKWLRRAAAICCAERDGRSGRWLCREGRRMARRERPVGLCAAMKPMTRAMRWASQRRRHADAAIPSCAEAGEQGLAGAGRGLHIMAGRTASLSAWVERRPNVSLFGLKCQHL